MLVFFIICVLLVCFFFFFFFKQKTAYEMRISDWSSDVCSSDLSAPKQPRKPLWLRNGAGGRVFLTQRSIRQNQLSEACNRQRAKCVIAFFGTGVESGG